METIAAALPYIAVASGVASAGLGIVQGAQASQAASLERQQFEDEAQTARLAAQQEENARRHRLAAILSENEALRGARGLSFESGSERAIREENIRAAEADIGTVRLNRLGQVRRAELGAAGARMRETGGLFSGAGAFASGLGTAATSLLRYAPATKGT
jgi:hypothetical protein